MRAALRSWSSMVPASPGCMKAWPPMATMTMGFVSFTAPYRVRKVSRIRSFGRAPGIISSWRCFVATP